MRDSSTRGERRRLEAILAADAVGFSRLMALDEDATVAALDASRAVFKSRIVANQGRTIDMAGDSVLAVFETAIGAVNAALEIQNELGSLANAMAADRRMRFRLGVHLGDVIEKPDGTVYGDGVNIAARLQALAEPGGVAVSGMVQEAVRDRISATFEDQGEHAVKNIARPVRVYWVNSSRAGSAGAGVPMSASPVRRLRWRILALCGLLLAVATGTWIAGDHGATIARGSLASIFGNKPVQPATTRPGIAVMPFVNQSGDPKRDYFSDGITDDVIHALGRFSGVMVMSRHAVQAYKGRDVTPAEIGRELGVRYIANGSVRQADDMLRIALGLSDAGSGRQLWSERYEGAGAQVFEIQDRLVRDIVSALAVNLSRIEQQRVFTKPTNSLEAYDLVLRARALVLDSNRVSNRQARELLAKALELAPDYAEAYIAYAAAETQRSLDYGWTEDPAQSAERAEQYALRALALGDVGAQARAHGQLGVIYSAERRYDQALVEADRAVALNPSDARALETRGVVLMWLGRVAEAVAAFDTVERFDPAGRSAGAVFSRALAFYTLHRYGEALAVCDTGIARFPQTSFLHAMRAATLGQMGELSAASAAAGETLRLEPFFHANDFGDRFADPKMMSELQQGLRKAGL